MADSLPTAPLYLHDLADLLHAHLHTHAAPTSHYENLRAIYTTHSFDRIHNSNPRCIPPETYTQHLFQAALTLTPPLLRELCCPSAVHVPPAATLSLLTLLFVTQPAPAERVRVTDASLARLRRMADADDEAAVLMRYLMSINAFRRVAQLVHGPAYAPKDLVAAPFPQVLKLWKPSALYGYDVPVEGAVEQIAKWTPACPVAKKRLVNERPQVKEENMPSS